MKVIRISTFHKCQPKSQSVGSTLICVGKTVASFPGTPEKSAWYPLFVDAQLPRFFLENLEATVILVHVARRTLLNYRSRCIYMHPSLFCHLLHAILGFPTLPRAHDTALLNKTSLQQGHVCMATNRYGKYTCMNSYNLFSCLASTLERQKQHIAITDLQATFLHDVAAHCNRISC